MIITPNRDELIVYPASYRDFVGAESTSYPLTNPISKSSGNTTYAQWTMPTGSGAESYVFYKFDLSAIPADAVIDSVSCDAKGYISSISSNYIATRQMQLYTLNDAIWTAKGTALDLTTAAVARTITAGNWMREELEECYIRIYAKRGSSGTSTTRTMRFYGATLTVAYTYDHIQYEITVSASGGEIEPKVAIVDAGDTVNFTLNAYKGYALREFTDNDDDVLSSVTRAGSRAYSYVLNDVYEDHLLVAVFHCYCSEVFGELVTNRSPGAYYNADDINRIGRAANCLSIEMTSMGYQVNDELQTEWTIEDIYYDTDAEFLFAVLDYIKCQIASSRAGNFPSTMDRLDYLGANEIEQFLLNVNDILEAIKEAYPQCGTLQAGGVLI